MRLKCVFRTAVLPVTYNMLFLSLIKECIKSTNEKYFKSLFYYNDGINKKSKNYSFSVSLNRFVFEKEVFKIDEEVYFTISSPDSKFFINIYNGLLKIDTFRYKDFFLNKKRISLIQERIISENTIVFKTLSPICIKDKDGDYLDIEDAKFTDGINYLADMILKNFRGKGISSNLYFDPINMKKVVVKIDDDFFKGDKKKYMVNSYKGIFRLSGDIEDLNLLYQLGLSFRRNQGFGMLEVI